MSKMVYALFFITQAAFGSPSTFYHALRSTSYQPRLLVNQKTSPATWWHYTTASTGLFNPPGSPSLFLPHQFTLHQLAPQQGKGVRLTLIDTGVAGFQLLHHTHYIPHPELAVEYNDTFGCLDCSSQAFQNSVLCAQALATLLHTSPLDIIHLVQQWLHQSVCHSGKKAFSSLTTYIKHSPHAHVLQAAKQTVQHYAQFLTRDCVRQGPAKIIPIVKEFLPLAPPTKTLNPAHHGTHTYGLVQHICPQATLIMIKAFDDQCISDKATLIAALEKARDLQSTIVLLGLKIDDSVQPDSPASCYLQGLLAQIPYTVAAAGNDGQIKKLSYPARCAHTTLSVGAFGKTDTGLYIPPFSQAEPEKRRTYLAPGVDIISTAIPRNIQEYLYLQLSGTSSAAALVAGFLALVLAEFQQTFSKEQIVLVLNASTSSKQTDPYPFYVLDGILDMRLALFMLHVLKKCKKTTLDKHHFAPTINNLKNIIRTAPESTQHSLKQAINSCAKRLMLLAEPGPETQKAFRVERSAGTLRHNGKRGPKTRKTRNKLDFKQTLSQKPRQRD